jgi:hypothetical protein
MLELITITTGHSTMKHLVADTTILDTIKVRKILIQHFSKSIQMLSENLLNGFDNSLY